MMNIFILVFDIIPVRARHFPRPLWPLLRWYLSQICRSRQSTISCRYFSLFIQIGAQLSTNILELRGWEIYRGTFFHTLLLILVCPCVYYFIVCIHILELMEVRNTEEQHIVMRDYYIKNHHSFIIMFSMFTFSLFFTGSFMQFFTWN